jgi:hypothetical protein
MCCIAMLVIFGVSGMLCENAFTQRLMHMQIGPTERAILDVVAGKCGATTEDLADVIEQESAEGLARALGLASDEAASRMARIRRAVTIDDDWGAGCKLLTDDVRAELHAALRALGDTDYSASLGVSQG